MRRSLLAVCLLTALTIVAARPAVADDFRFYFAFGPDCG